jgi:hypothetical protein
MSGLKMIPAGMDLNNNPVYKICHNDGRWYDTATYSKEKAEEIVGVEFVEQVEEVQEVQEVIVEEPSSSFGDMTKLELETLMRKHDIELDRRKTKKDLVEVVTDYFSESEK